MTIYIAGNSIVNIDNKPVLLIDRLKKDFNFIDFKIIDSVDDIDLSDKIYLIDTVHGISHVTVFFGMSNFLDSPRFTMHDFDIGIMLKLMLKIGYIKNICIFGIPPFGDLDKIYEELKIKIKATLSSKN